jgi:hypothetical protein
MPDFIKKVASGMVRDPGVRSSYQPGKLQPDPIVAPAIGEMSLILISKKEG